MGNENQKPLVSICCATYNHEPYVRECLEGFLMQKTNFPFEVLIHDDASTDGTADIIREYEAKYPDIIKPIYQTENQYSKPNHKPISLWNYERAQGKYIAICEGDDFWCDPEKLQIQVDFMESHPDYSLCGHNSYRLKKGKLSKRFKSSIPEKDITTVTDILCGNTFDTASIFFRYAMLINFKKFQDKCPVGDKSLELCLITHGKVHYLKKVMCVYRYGANNSFSERMVNKDNLKKLLMQHLIWLAQLKNIIPDYANEVRDAERNRIIELLVLEGKYQKLSSYDWSLKHLYVLSIKRRIMVFAIICFYRLCNCVHC